MGRGGGSARVRRIAANEEWVIRHPELGDRLTEKVGFGFAEPATMPLAGGTAQAVGVRRNADADHCAIVVAGPLAISGAIELDGKAEQGYLIGAHRRFVLIGNESAARPGAAFSLLRGGGVGGGCCSLLQQALVLDQRQPHEARRRKTG